MTKLNGHKAALVVGLFMGGLHALWALLVALIPVSLQNFLDWIFNVHFIEPVWVLTQFDFANALLLVLVTSVIGYAATWAFVWIWNTVKSKK